MRQGQEFQEMPGTVAQVVEHLPSKCEALNSNPISQKKEKKKNFRKENGGRHKRFHLE
jgi:hypothetical protein